MAERILSQREKAEWFRRRFGVFGGELIEERRTCSAYVSLARPRITAEDLWARLEALERLVAEA